MKIVVGLGNPGKEYEKTRHNTGWMFLDYLADKYGIKIEQKSKNLDSIVGEYNYHGEKLILAKPQTYMNLSGNAVQKLKKWYKVEEKDILIVFDDIDIPFGESRYKEKGSGGTHNGMKNIVEMLGSHEIARLKIGMGGIKHERQDLISFVLQKYSSAEQKELQVIFEEAYEKFSKFLDK